MKVKRNFVFETNSSTTHVMTMCKEADYEAWEMGEFLYDNDTDTLVPVDQCRYGNPDRYMTKKQYDDMVDSILGDCTGDYFEKDYEGIKSFGYFYSDY